MCIYACVYVCMYTYRTFLQFSCTPKIIDKTNGNSLTQVDHHSLKQLFHHAYIGDNSGGKKIRTMLVSVK